MMKREQFKELGINEQIYAIKTFKSNGNCENKYLKWFCKEHDPRTPPTQSHDALALQALVDLDFLRMTINTIAQQQPLEFVLLMRLCARIDGFEKTISGCRGVSVLVEVMQTKIKDSDIVENACIVFGLLATDVNVRASYSNEGVIAAMVKILEAHSHNSRIVAAVCKSLNNACYKSIPNKITFVQSEGFQLLISIFGVSILEDTAKQSAAMLLRNICNMDTSRMILLKHEETVIEDLLCVMQLVLDNAEAQIHLLWASLNLTVNWGKIKKEFGEDGGCVQIIESIRKHRDVVPLQKVACMAIYQLSKKRYNRILFGRNNGTTDITEILKRHKNISVLYWALNTLSKLCEQGINRKRMAQENCLPYVVKTLCEHIGNRKIVLASLGIIHKFAPAAGQSKAALRASDTLPTLSEVVKHYSTDIEIRTLANNSMSEVLKFADRDEEDSEESADSEDEEDTLNGADANDENETPNVQNVAEITVPDFSLKSLRSLIQKEKKDKKTNETPKSNENTASNQKLQQLLEQETQSRKKLEDEFLKLKQDIMTNERRQVEKLESVQQQLTKELEQANLRILELLSKTEKRQEQEMKMIDVQHKELELENKRSALDINNYKMEINNYKDEIKKYKEELKKKDSSIDTLQTMLFHYITLALKLHHFSGNRTPNSEFDKNAMFLKLVENKVEVEQWPCIIIAEMSKESPRVPTPTVSPRTLPQLQPPNSKNPTNGRTNGQTTNGQTTNGQTNARRPTQTLKSESSTSSFFSFSKSNS